MTPVATSIDDPMELLLLGPVRALRGGRDVALGGPRQRALLALLAIHPTRVVPAERLIDELWAGEPPGGAETTLRSYVSRLRTAIGDVSAIRGSTEGYALAIEPDAIDAIRFERLIRDGEAALAARHPRRAAATLRAALAMWRGRPFGELADDGLLQAEAGRLDELRLHAIEQRVEADLQLGRAAEVVDELESLVLEHPFREHLWRHLMLALTRAGRQADALAAYQRVRVLLDEQLGLEPSEELRDLEVRILRQEVPAATVPEIRHALPAPLTSFVGREGEVAECLGLLRTSRLVTLSGVGGVGKTRLALEVARLAVDDFADGVAFVDLAQLSDPALLPGHVEAALDGHDQAAAPRSGSLIDRVRDRELLLVFDNCEHLREECAALASRLLAAAPSLRVLATSRELLGVPGEADQAVPPLGLPGQPGDVAAARGSAAVRLLLERARSVRPRLDDTDATILTAAAIVSDLDGLPLAIELAAARAKALSLPDIAARLDDRFRFLVSWRRLTSARHRTLREAIDWSYELLAPDEQELLARLSAFVGGFTLAAVAAVAADGDEDAALRHVERLVDASLVVVDETPQGTRYRLLETIRQYGAEQLSTSGRRDETLDAHRRYFTELAESTATRGPAQAEGIARLDADLGNLRAAMDDAIARGDHEGERRLAVALWRFWQVRGLLAEGRMRLRATVERGPDVAPSLFSLALYGAGVLDWCVGDYAHGRRMANELLDVAQTTGSVKDEYAGHRLLASIALRERDFAESELHSLRAIELSGELGSEIDTLIAVLNHAVLLLDAGRIDESVTTLTTVREDLRRAGHAEGVALAELNLGEASYKLGDDVAAEVHFLAARESFAAIGFRAHVGHAVQGLAGVEARRGNHLVAARLLGEGEAILTTVGASSDDFAPHIVDAAFAASRGALSTEAFEQAFGIGQKAGRSD